MSAKGKKGAVPSSAAAAASASAAAGAVKAQPTNPAALVMKQHPQPVPPLELLTDEQKQLAQKLIPLQTEDTTEVAVHAGQLKSLKQVGLPLSQRDLVALVHESMSNIVGHNVHFRPYVFSNIFQSAPVVADYVAAAMEAGYSWSRIERFFLSSVEADNTISGIKVLVSGRLGRKADMASMKEWKYGDHGLESFRKFVDYGAASALTRLGIIGVKVWINYAEHAILANYFTRRSGFKMHMYDILQAPCSPLPCAGASAWWAMPATEQPPSHQTHKAFARDFLQTLRRRGDLRSYTQSQGPLVFHDRQHLRQFRRWLQSVARKKTKHDNLIQAISGDDICARSTLLRRFTAWRKQQSTRRWLEHLASKRMHDDDATSLQSSQQGATARHEEPSGHAPVSGALQVATQQAGATAAQPVQAP